MVDGESKEIKYVWTVKRIPQEQRWDQNNLEWNTVVPWNKRIGDKDADGDLTDFDVKKGLGRQLTEEEKQEIKMRKADGDQHSHWDRCPGYSAILKGLNVQPHTAQCRNRMETSLASAIRVKNAKARTQERSAKMKGSPNEIPDTAKRRKLEDIEDQAIEGGGSDQACQAFRVVQERVPRAP